MRRAPNLSARGFTTMELLVTLAIFGIVLAAAIPGFGSMMESHRFRGAVNEVTSRFAVTRQMAVRDKIPYVVSLDTAAGQLSTFADNNNNGNFDANERAFGPYPLGPKISLVNLDLANNQVTFLPSGSASQTGDLQVVGTGGRIKTIRVNAITGRAAPLP